jgi:hypothetical protein
MLGHLQYEAFDNRIMERTLVEDISSDRGIQKEALIRSFKHVRFNRHIVRKVSGVDNASLRPFERRRPIWEGVTKMDIEGKECEGVN